MVARTCCARSDVHCRAARRSGISPAPSNPVGHARIDLGDQLAGDQGWRRDGSSDLVRVLPLRDRNLLPLRTCCQTARAYSAATIGLAAGSRFRSSPDGHVFSLDRSCFDYPSTGTRVRAGLFDADLGRPACGLVVTRTCVATGSIRAGTGAGGCADYRGSLHSPQGSNRDRGVRHAAGRRSSLGNLNRCSARTSLYRNRPRAGSLANARRRVPAPSHGDRCRGRAAADWNNGCSIACLRWADRDRICLLGSGGSGTPHSRKHYVDGASGDSRPRHLDLCLHAWRGSRAIANRRRSLGRRRNSIGHDACEQRTSMTAS